MSAKKVPQLHPKLKKFQESVEKRTNVRGVFVTPKFQQEYTQTGSTIVNLLIGGSRLQDGTFVCPGWPRGTISEVFGRESSGKSTIAMTGMAHAINSQEDRCGLYVDLECAVRDHYAMKLGVDFRSPEQGGNGRALRAQPHSFEETEALVTAAALQGVDFIVIDSVAGLVSNREIKRDTSDDDQKAGVAEIPRLMSTWMPKLQQIIARTGTHCMFLNQTRDKIGASKFAKSEEALKTTTGGNALKFWSSLRLMLKPRVSAKAKRWNPLTRQNEDIQISTDVEIKMIKNKIDSTQGHSGLITIRYGVGIDELRTMLNVAEAYSVIKKSKNAKKQEVFRFDSESRGTIEIVGIEKFRQELEKQKMIDELIARCTDNILDGFKIMDNDRLAQLAEDAIVRREGDDEDYETDDGPEVVKAEDDEEVISNEVIDEDQDLI